MTTLIIATTQLTTVKMIQKHDDIQKFVRRTAADRKFTPGQTQRLSEKTRLVDAWEKRLVRVVGFLRTYSADHPTPKRGIDELVSSATTFIDQFGPLALQIGPSFVSTEEGFPISRRGGDKSYVFLPLFRDGIRAVSLLKGELEEDLILLLSVLAHEGTREGDDAVTWLWSGRLRHIRVEVAPWYPPRVAAALHLNEPGHHVFSASVQTLLAAGAHAPPSDPRTPIDRDCLSQLAHHGVDADQTLSVLAGGPLDDRFDPVSDMVKNECQTLFDDYPELRRRARLIRTRYAR